MTAMRLDELLDITPIVPVVSLERLQDALPLGQALLEAGVGLIELTLRTPAALPAIEQLAARMPELVVAAGTVLTPAQLRAVSAAGARLAIAPGCTPALLQAALDDGLPLLPGVATASELMLGMDAGLRHFKLFPASVVGGLGWLQAIHGPFAEARFCPTGGIGPEQVAAYLRLPNVACVGASWLASRSLIDAGDWPAISRAARSALQAAAAVAG